MRTHIARTSVIGLLIFLLPTFVPASASAATAKIGASCSKAGATATTATARLVCKKNSRGKLVWQKYVESADCLQAKAQYANQLRAYQDIITKIAEARTAAAGLSGTQAEQLRIQINGTEEAAKQLKALVDSLAGLTAQICKLG